LRKTTSFDVLSVKIRAGVLAVGDWKNQKNKQNATLSQGPPRDVPNVWVPRK